MREFNKLLNEALDELGNASGNIDDFYKTGGLKTTKSKQRPVTLGTTPQQSLGGRIYGQILILANKYFGVSVDDPDPAVIKVVTELGKAILSGERDFNKLAIIIGNNIHWGHGPWPVYEWEIASAFLKDCLRYA